MKRNSKTNNQSELTYDPERILLFVDSDEIECRVRALDILGQYLDCIYKYGLTSDPNKDNSLKISISFAILTRCDDISPKVRAKALSVLSRVAKNIVNFLEETEDQTFFKIEDSVDISELELEVNGEHRFYWYCMTSLEERRKEIMAILHRRIEDNCVEVRKATIEALEKLMVADGTLVINKNLKCLKSAFKDSKGYIRCQSIRSLSIILLTYQNNSEIQEFWLQCVLPLVDDSEDDQVQSTALSGLEELFLLQIFNFSIGSADNLSMVLLKKLISGDFLIYHKFLDKAFSEWGLMNKLKSAPVDKLRSYVETDWEDCLWLYLSLYAKYCLLPLEFSKTCVERMLYFFRAREYPEFMQYVLKTFLRFCETLHTEILGNVQCIANDSLASFSIPVELIPLCVKIPLKITKLKETESEFQEFSFAIIETCEAHLTDIQSQALFEQPLPQIDLLGKYFCTLTEFLSFCQSYIAPKLIGLLKCFAGFVEFPVALPSNVKAHALVALGKFCLQDEILARELLPTFSEKLSSKDNSIRSNACIILIDMCTRYLVFADVCIPIISFCFKDEFYLIRYQTIVQIIKLIQCDYIKWKLPLIYGFLSALIDKKEPIRDLGHQALSFLFRGSNEGIKRWFPLDHFSDSIFVLNRFSPPDDEIRAEKVKKLVKFSVPGENKRKKRMVMYRFFLEHMDQKDKATAIEFICGIMTNIAESVYNFNKFTECLLRDCFSILTCNEIKTINLSPIENLNEELENELSRIEVSVRRTLLVDPVIKVISSLINNVKNPESDMVRDIILFLKDLLADFADDIDDILSEDKFLLNHLKLEIKKDHFQRRMLIERKKELLTGKTKEIEIFLQIS